MGVGRDQEDKNNNPDSLDKCSKFCLSWQNSPSSQMSDAQGPTYKLILVGDGGCGKAR
jgi:GTPase SAR1 family protein